jgi:hypothetical protein
MEGKTLPTSSKNDCDTRESKHTTAPLVSIVILAWNRRSELEETLKRISESTYRNYEIIVVDNASTDDTCRMVRCDFPEARLIRLPSNKGIYGYNVGFCNAKGEYVIVLDDDSHPAPDAIEKALEVFTQDTDKNIGIIAFRIVNPIKGRDFTSAWPEGDWVTFWGCGAAIRREVLESVGDYDEDFFIYANEYDLSIRVLNAGWRVVYCPQITAYHRESKKHRSWKRTGWIGARNEAWFHIKHFPWWSLPLLAFWTCSRYAWRGMRKRSLSCSYYNLAGYIRGWISFRTPLAKRKPVKASVVKKYFRHHWLIAPVSKGLLRAVRAPVK